MVGVEAAENGGEVGVVETVEEAEISFDFYLTLVHDGLRVGHGKVLDFRQQGIVFPGVGVLEEALHEAVGGEETLAGREDGAVPVFGFHQLEHGGVFALHGGLGGHVAGDSFGVADHGEEVPGGDGIVGGVADTDFFREEEGIGDGAAEFVALLGLGAPVDAAVAADGELLAVDGAGGGAVEQAVHLFVEYVFADDPAALGCGGGKVGVLAGEKFGVIDAVAVFEALEFFREGVGDIAADLGVEPLDQQFALFLGGLAFRILGRHIAEMDLLLGFGEDFLQIDGIDGLKRIETDVTLLLFLAVAGKAVGLHDLHRLVTKDGGIHFGFGGL